MCVIFYYFFCSPRKRLTVRNQKHNLFFRLLILVVFLGLASFSLSQNVVTPACHPTPSSPHFQYLFLLCNIFGLLLVCGSDASVKLSGNQDEIYIYVSWFRVCVCVYLVWLCRILDHSLEEREGKEERTLSRGGLVVILRRDLGQ